MDEIGARLREARTRQRIDINDVEARIKIRAKYVRAMENEEWDLLPGEVYVRTFLRTYADFLGLDSRELLDEFRRRYESPSDHEPPPIVPPGRERREREQRAARGGGSRYKVPSWVLVGAVIAVVVAVLVVVGTRGSGGAHTATHPAVATTPAHRSHQRSGATRRHRTVSSASTTTHAAVSRTVTVAVTPTGTAGSYVCLEDAASGHILVDGTYPAGATVPTATGTRLLLTVSSGQATVTANGKALALPAGAAAGAAGSTGAAGAGTGAAALTLRITPTGHRVISAPASNLTCGA